MKRLIFLFIAFVGANFTSLAQNKIDFFDLAKSFDWGLSECAFKEKYSDRIISNTDSISIPISGFQLKEVYVDKYETITFVRYEPSSKQPVIVSIPIVGFLDSINHTVYTDLEKIVDDELANPDFSLTDMDLAAFSGAADLGFEKGNMKMWVSSVPAFMTITAGDNERYLFAISAVHSMVPDTEREPDFRKGFWGDSMADIKKKEGKADELDLDDVYAFTTYVAGLECVGVYRFSGDKLTSGKYIFLNNNSDNCIENYNMLVNLLTKKYGTPFSNDKTTTASSYQQRTYTDGELVRRGNMKFETYWSTPFSMIAIILSGSQYRINLVIEYYSYELKEERENDILKDL